MRIIIFICSKNRILQKLLINKYTEKLLMVFYYCEKFIFTFRYFSLYTGSLSNSFLILFLTFFQILLYFSHNSSFFIGFIKVSSICTYFWEKYTYRSNSFIIFVANEILNPFLPRDLIRYYYFFNI